MRPAVVLLVLLLPGCLTAADDPARYALQGLDAPVAPLGADAYALVWVHGHQDAPSGGNHVMCSIALNHEINATARTLRMAPGAERPEAPQRAFVFDVFEKESDCPVAYAVAFDRTTLQQPVGRFGTLGLVALANGSIEADGHLVPPGSKLVVEHAHGGFEVENRGAWPRSGLSWSS